MDKFNTEEVNKSVTIATVGIRAFNCDFPSLQYINNLAYNIDIHETLIKAESLCLQLLALPDLPDDVRTAVTGKNVAMMTPDVDRTDPFLMMRSPQVARLLSMDDESSSAQASAISEAEDDILVIRENGTSSTNDLSAGNDTGHASHCVNSSVGETALNVEHPSSDDDVIVLSEEVENIF